MFHNGASDNNNSNINSNSSSKSSSPEQAPGQGLAPGLAGSGLSPGQGPGSEGVDFMHGSMSMEEGGPGPGPGVGDRGRGVVGDGIGSMDNGDDSALVQGPGQGLTQELTPSSSSSSLLSSRPRVVLVHCAMGVSRSPAMVIILMMIL